MSKFSLASKGLSMTQAQSISNYLHQSCIEIDRILNNLNNFSSIIKIDGESYVVQQPSPINNDDVHKLLLKKGRYYALQAFLMENIKAKEDLIESKKKEKFHTTLEKPEIPDYISTYDLIKEEVDEEWGYNQLTSSEYNAYLEATAYASHIGQFIHAKGKLSNLREELPNIPTITYQEIEVGKKTPVKINIHHKSDDLLSLHEKLAGEHRKYEQKANYYKAKVKNLVTTENANRNKFNADIQNETNNKNSILSETHENLMKEYHNAVLVEKKLFEKTRNEQIQIISSYRIQVDPIFQPTVDEVVAKLEIMVSKEEGKN